MGVSDRFEELKDKGKNVVGDNAEKGKEGVDQAAEKADGATGGKHADKVKKGADTARDGIDRTGGA